MGQSTDAILCYGVQLGEDDEPLAFMEGFDELDDLLLKEGNQPRWGDEGHDFQSQWAWLATQPVEMVHHCSGNYTMYIIALRGTVTTASRGYPEEVATYEPDHVAVQHFMQWLLDHNIDGEPKWLLCSMWK